MADDGMGLFGKHQSEIASLKDTLHAQQNLLHKLYNELEAEREASSTAASEALSMILRIQGEKAAVKMEAEQYKRLVEEKMCHAEASLSIFEDLIYQKEMEVASLDYQVQAYRYKVISMGCSDPGIGEIKLPDNLLKRNEGGTLGRRNSAPLYNFKFLNQKKGALEREDSTSPDREEQGSNNLSRTANSSMTDNDSYSEQIRRLDERVREVAGVHLRSETSSPLPFSLSSPANSSNKLRLVSMNEIQQETPGVHDVFEVPQVDLDNKSQGKTVSFAEKNLSMPSETVSDSNVTIVRPTARAATCKSISIQKIRTSEIIEVGNQVSREEPSGRREVLILLSQIKDQLNTIQSEIINLNLKTNHSVSKEKQTFESYMETSLIEEMLGFWL